MQPQRILQYEIIERLGEGPHGESYRARDTANGRIVVLKLINGEVFHEDSEIDLFKAAMLRLIDVAHPNLAALYAVDETDEAVLIAHEYVEGAGIGELLEQGPLPYEKFLDFAIQIADGIKALHTRGLIHGHISTDNVMIDQSGNVKLLDYGLPALGPAYLEEESSDSQRVSVWTAEDSEQPPEADADFFALGGLFYEMLTGRAPYSDQGEESTAGLAALPPEAQLLVEKLLSTEKEDQFTGAEELLVTLREMKQFAENPPRESDGKHASPLSYLIISIVAFVLIILWWVATMLKK
jgi:eukaryotic-like serine/threonine-protein kinase